MLITKLDEIFSDYETNKIIKRDDNLCTGSILNTMYNCIHGVCTQVKGKF